MKSKLTILLALLALGASQAYAQAGYLVSRSITTSVQHGKNQVMGEIELRYSATTANIDAGNTITVTFGDLSISTGGTLECDKITCDNKDSIFENDEDTGVGTVTIDLTNAKPEDGGTINLSGVRTDVSGLDAGDEIIATISTSTPGGLIPVGQSARQSVAAVVSKVKAGLAVEIDAASRLICNLDAKVEGEDVPVGGVPMITVSEGFDDAWEDSANKDALGGTTIAIVTMNLPDGVELRFPESVTFINPDDDDNTVWATLTLSGDSATEAVVGKTSDEANDGSMVTYAYTQQEPADSNGVVDSFAIPITVVTSDIDSGAAGIADIWAFLSPQPGDDDENIDTVLSYVKNPVTDPDTDDGDFLNIAECVTYLLFPYITCGAHADWDTGIAIANTTMDDGIFGLSAGATAQRGSVTMYAFPTGEKTDDNATEMGYTGEPTMAMISGGLAAGDSLAMSCSGNEMLAGMQGYAIVKAGFRHAHGMAFVMNLTSGAVDAVHGYIALVIPDPEFGGMNADRAAAEGEVLGH